MWGVWAGAGAAVVIIRYTQLSFWLEAHGPGLLTSFRAPLDPLHIAAIGAVGAAAGLIARGILGIGLRVFQGLVRWSFKFQGRGKDDCS